MLREAARRDILFFFNQFLWTYDPRKEAAPHHHPFFLYDFQEQFLLTLEEQYAASADLLLEKSRDMGASWLVLGWIVWHWCYDKSFNALVGSRKEDMVDNGEIDSLLGKCEYLIARLPPWMRPVKWRPERHRKTLLLKNPDNHNTIQGESANKDFARQGRFSAILLDEFAFWDWASSVWTATADSSPVRFVVSTPCGKQNKFAQLRFPEPGQESIRVVSLHWSLHPKKDEAWYEAEKARRTPREIAQELDLDYEASGNERVFSILQRNADLRHAVHRPVPDIPHEVVQTPQGKTLVNYFWNLSGGLDYGTRNPTSFHVFARDFDGRHYAIWEWVRTREQLLADGFQGSMVQAIGQMLRTECPYYAALDVIRCDPSLWAETQNAADGMTSIHRQLVAEGIMKLTKGAQSDLDAIEKTLSLWADAADPQFLITTACPELWTELQELLWDDWNESLGMRRDKKEKIVDKANHSWDSWKYYILGNPKPAKDPRTAHNVTYDQRVHAWQDRRRKQLARMKERGGWDSTLGSQW